MKVQPTEEQVQNGGWGPSNCPYALAIESACEYLRGRISVYPFGVYIYDVDFVTRIKTIPASDEMNRWIVAYDEKSPTLSAPPAVDLPLEEFCAI